MNNFYNPYAMMCGASGAMPDQLAYMRGMQQQPQMQQQPRQNNGLIWVQGEAGAKSHPLNPGETALLMDSEDGVFYIKTVDVSGMPLPLRTFDYAERTASTATTQNSSAETAKAFNSDKFITREEFNAKMSEMAQFVQGIRASENGGNNG